MTQNSNSQQNPNMKFYDQFRAVPNEAKKPINDGRLRGKTDINPVWRIKRLTEIFGPMGFGWKVEIVRKWLEQGDPDTVAAFVDLNLYVKDPETGQWSEAIPGTGGSTFRRKESNGKNYIDDDAYKKAQTDALSVAAKYLGVAADVYFEQDRTKYDTSQQGAQAQAPAPAPTVRNRPTQGAAPAAQQQASGKPVLDERSPFWLQSVATAMSAPQDPAGIRQRISTKFSISDEDFLKLMKAAGRAPQDATSI
jgi:hypothetical protein